MQVDTKTAVYTTKKFLVAQNYGVDLIAYEGGPHLVATGANMNNVTLTDKLIAASRDDRMKEIHMKMCDVWFDNGGGIFTAFVNIDNPCKYGSFGILEYQDQPIGEAPKFSAFQQFMTSGSMSPHKPFDLRVNSN